MVVHTLKYIKKIDLMLVVFTKQTKIPEITEGSGGYV